MTGGLIQRIPRVVARVQALRDRAQVRVGRWLEDPEREDSVFLVLTLLIGAVVGLAIVAFILLTERLSERMFPIDDAPWRRLVIPVGTAAVTGVLLHYYFPDARGSGIPQTKTALLLHRGRISLRTVLGKFFCTAATIAAGIPLGREGPSVQVGAGIASVLGRALRLSTTKVRQLVPVGATAAVAAAFNTPIAAVLFTLEELLGNLHAPVLGNVVLGAATSWLVLRLALGDEPLFSVPAYDLVHPGELIVYALLGVIGGLVSVGFVRLLLHLRARFAALDPRTRPLQPLAGALAVGLLALGIPEVLGTGYRFIGDALQGSMLLSVMAPLVVIKLFSVALAYASGNAGGVFGPSLFMGAMVGGSVGTLAHWALPAHTATPGAYALVGMGAMFAGTVRAPFTSVIMIFELTHDYHIIVPLMVTNAAALFVSRRLQPEPLYAALARQDGTRLPESAADAARERLVRQVMRAPTAEERAALDVVRREAAHLRIHPDDTLDRALEKLGSTGARLAPVHEEEPAEGPERVVSVADILRAYGLTPPDFPPASATAPTAARAVGRDAEPPAEPARAEAPPAPRAPGPPTDP